jgi:hypothetical protein
VVCSGFWDNTPTPPDSVSGDETSRYDTPAPTTIRIPVKGSYAVDNRTDEQIVQEQARLMRAHRIERKGLSRGADTPTPPDAISGSPLSHSDA